MAETPSKEPSEFRAGDSVKWQKSIDDYKASAGWSLAYAFRGPGGVIDVTASASGDEHLVEITPTTSAAYTAGIYDVIGYVTKGA